MGPQTHCVCHEILLASYPGRCGGGKDVFPPPQRPGYEARNTACVYSSYITLIGVDEMYGGMYISQLRKCFVGCCLAT